MIDTRKIVTILLVVAASIVMFMITGLVVITSKVLGGSFQCCPSGIHLDWGTCDCK